MNTANKSCITKRLITNHNICFSDTHFNTRERSNCVSYNVGSGMQADLFIDHI